MPDFHEYPYPPALPYDIRHKPWDRTEALRQMPLADASRDLLGPAPPMQQYLPALLLRHWQALSCYQKNNCINFKHQSPLC